MTSSVNPAQNNALPPPQLGDFAMITMAPPLGYEAREKVFLDPNRTAQFIGSGALTGSAESLAQETSVRVPSYNDKYKVYDANGDVVLGVDGRPLDLRTSRLIPGEPKPDEPVMPYYTTVDGKQLKLEVSVPKNRGFKNRIGVAIYNRYDDHYNFEAAESAQNAENQKVIQDTVGTGPDDDERIVFAASNVNGRLQKYNGTALTPVEIANYNRQMTTARTNKARYQGLAAYEIGKREEQEQGGGLGIWLQIANKMHSELGYTKKEIDSVYIGLQYMKKGQYLTIKHTPLLLVDRNGNKLDASSKLSRAQLEGSKYIFGTLKERDYVNELAEKLAGHQTTFSSADVVDALRLSRVVKKRMDAKENSGTVRQKNRRVYQNDGFIMHKLWSAVENSRMASPSEPGKDGVTPENVIDQTRQALEGRGGYPPRISGSAEANQAWKILAKVVDETASSHPVVKVFNEEEYSASGSQLR